jgi:hypothetical protein
VSGAPLYESQPTELGAVPEVHVDLDLAVDLNDDATEVKFGETQPHMRDQNEHVFGARELDDYQCR